MKKKIKKIVYFIILFIIILINFSCIWCNRRFGAINIDSVIFQLSSPITGTDSSLILSFIYFPLLCSILTTIFVYFIISYKYKVVPIVEIKAFKHNFSFNLIKLINKLRYVIIILFLGFTFLFVNYFYSFRKYFALKGVNSTFIEENYVDARDLNIKFNKKKNLIVIGSESMEKTYMDKKNGGAYDVNYIPYLTKLMDEGISFSDKNKKGIYPTDTTGWTMASVVAQSSGIGLSLSAFDTINKSPNDMLDVYSLGNLLRDNGYNLVAFGGSPDNFAYTERYFNIHGNFDMKYLKYFKSKKLVPNNYSEWWGGLEDSKLFEFSKSEILDLASQDKPFYIDFRTMNTHFSGGYLEKNCEMKYDEQLKNVVSCSDKQIYEFIEWIKSQDFYKDTVIVITGDHLSMEPNFFKNIKGYQRTNYNVFLNTGFKNKKEYSDRFFNSFDIYPTIVASLGINIPGNRLGLGTNLFSDRKTIYEEYGKSFVDEELGKRSIFYYDLLYGKE